MPTDREKRLLFVPGFFADTYNVIERRYVALHASLRDRLEMVWCLPPEDPEQWIWAHPDRKGEEPTILGHLRDLEAEVLRIPVHKPSFLRRVRLFKELFAREHFDGVYAVFGPRLAPLYAAKKSGLTTIWDAAWNSLAPGHYCRLAKKIFYRRYIDYYVASTNDVADNLVSNGIRRDRMMVRWNAIDFSTIPDVDEAAARARIRAELGLPPDAEVIVQLTSFRPVKNVAMVARVLRKLRDRRSNVFWLLVGEDGPHRGAVLKLAQELGVSDYLICPGHRRDIWDLNAAADVVALTSLQEGLPNALLEGMSMRRPIVTTRANSLDAFIEDGVVGHVVDDNDVEAFANRLTRLLDDPELRKQMGSAGRAKVERDCNIDRWCERVGGFLCQALGVEANRPAEPVLCASSTES